MSDTGQPSADGMTTRPLAGVLTLPNLISLLRLLLVPVFTWLALGGHDVWAFGVWSSPERATGWTVVLPGR